jgi:hypothetical protein
MITPCNDENFQKYVLWHLTGLRADMMQMQSIIFGGAAMPGEEPGEEVKAKWIAAHKKNWEVLFQDALAKCNLRPPQGVDTPIWNPSNNKTTSQ